MGGKGKSVEGRYKREREGRGEKGKVGEGKGR